MKLADYEEALRDKDKQMDLLEGAHARIVADLEGQVSVLEMKRQLSQIDFKMGVVLGIFIGMAGTRVGIGWVGI